MRQEVIRAVETNQSLPIRGTAGAKPPFRRTGDELTEHYFRAAARAASRLPTEQAVPAYLTALAVTLDTSDAMRKNPLTRERWNQIESDAERKHRLGVIGKPTMHGRHDLAQHFVVSAALTALHGAKAAESAGILKEMLDAQGGSGFSFADLTADFAGIAFAARLKETPRLLSDLETSFRVAAFLPDPSGLREGIPWKQFLDDYGSVTDRRFQAVRDEIDRRIRALPGYQPAPDRP